MYYKLLALINADSIWLLAGRIFAMLAGIIAVRILTELIDPVEYGRLALIMGLVNLVSLVLYTSIGRSANRYIWDYFTQDAGDTWVSTVIFVIIVSGIILTFLLCAAVILGVSFGINPSIVAWVVPTFLIAGALITTLLGMLNILQKHKWFVIGTVFYAWLQPSLAIVFVLIVGRTAESVMVGYASSSVLALFVAILAVWKLGLIKLSLSHDELVSSIDKMWFYAMPFVIVHLFYWIQTTAGRYVLDLNLGLEQVGIFVVATAIGRIPLQAIESVFGQVHQPILFRKIGNYNNQQANIVLLEQPMTDYTIAFLKMCIPIFLFTILGANILMKLLTGQEYWIGVVIIPWVAASEFLRALIATISVAFEVERHPQSLIFPIAAASLVTLFFTYALSNSFGLMGAGVALTLGMLTWLLLIWIPALRLLCWHFPWFDFLKVSFASGVIAISAWWMGHLVLSFGLVVQAIIFMLTFGIGYLFFTGHELLG